MKLNYKRTILVGFAFFLISAFWQAYDAIVPLALTNHFGLPQSVSGVVMSLDNILAVFMLPIFGSISDKVNTKWGKRTPFILCGTIVAVLSFVALTFVDNYQLSLLALTEAPELFAESLVEGADKAALQDAAKALALELTVKNPVPLIGFLLTLLVVLIAMATFRSPAVALMPDVTIKPLRSKGNAIINLMGTAGGIIVLAFGSIFSTGKNLTMSYTGYVLAVCGVMITGLFVFLLTVKEKAWADEMEEETKRLGLEDAPEEKKEDNGVKVIAEKRDGKLIKQGALPKDQFKSLMLILASVALWYIGYNSITSKYSVYAVNELGVDYGLTLIVAQAAAIVSYIPVGIIASKLGRRKTILAGITMLASAFIIGAFIGEGVNPLVMYPVFMLAGIGWATINVNSFPMVVELAKGGEVGKYTGYYYTASMAAQICAPILSGFLYDIFGMRYIFFPFGAIFVIGSFITMYFVRHGDSKPDAKSVVEDALAGDD
ncbi:MAG: MFS transporter [Clostridia bacterium]|nr:MFS transporter [Clostridia bacterium]